VVTTSASATASADTAMRRSTHVGPPGWDHVAIRRILGPVDFSEFSRAAGEQATLLARACRAEVTALFVFLPCAWPRSARQTSS